MKESGKRIGDYLLLDLLGKGGMGSVYLAEHAKTGQVAALKTVRLAKRNILTQLRREIEALSQIRHPGIVGIIDQGEYGGRPWYAMELVTGTTLREYLRTAHPPLDSQVTEDDGTSSSNFQADSQHSLEPEIIHELVEEVQEMDLVAYMIDEEGEESGHRIEAIPVEQHISVIPDTLVPTTQFDTTPSGELPHSEGILFSWEIPQSEGGTKPHIKPTFERSLAIIQGLCTTLAYLHGEGIVHCDLKPENIILQEDGWPMLIDFGLLVQFAGGVNRERLELTHEGSGTLPYMSPEQLNGELLDARADIYSLGCILYELLVGEPPFVGHRYEIVAQHMFNDPIPPSMRVENIPPQLDELLIQMLAKNRQDRIGYADVVGARLMEWVPQLQQHTRFNLHLLPDDDDDSLKTSRRLRPITDDYVTEEHVVEKTVPNAPFPTPPPPSKNDLFTVKQAPVTSKEQPVRTDEGWDQPTAPLETVAPESSPLVVQSRSPSHEIDPLEHLPLPRVYLYRPSLIGRQQSWSQLKKAVDELKKAQGGGLALITGESGLGKTRLILELAQYARSKQVQIVTSSCQEDGGPMLKIFHPFLEVLGDQMRERKGFEQPLWDSDAPAQESSEGLFGGPSFVTSGPQSPSHAHLRIYQTLHGALSEFTQNKPLLFLIDDLHWADEVSLGALGFLSRPDALPNVLFVGAYRKEELPVSLKMLATQKSVHNIELKGLDDQEIMETVSDMLAMPEVPSPLAQALIRYAKGNPYFVAEYLHVAVAEGLLHRDIGGQWYYDQALTVGTPLPKDKTELSLHVPHSLRELVLRRVSKLPDDARMVLAIVAVVGRRSPVSLLQEVSGMAIKKWWQIVEQLQRMLILEVQEGEFVGFVHDQFREAVYTELSSAARAMYHRRVAETLVEFSSHGFGMGDTALHIARHWEHANELKKAGDAYLEAAREAQEQLIFDKAIRCYEWYLALANDTRQESLDARLEMIELLTMQGQMEQAQEQIDLALQNAKQLNDRLAEADIRLRLGQLFWHRGRRALSRQITEEALHIYQDLETNEESGEIKANLGHCFFYQYEWKEAQRNYREAMVLFRNEGDQMSQGQMMLSLAKLALHQGKLNDARELSNNALALFHDMGEQRQEAVSLLHLADAHLYQNKPEQAVRLSQRALAQFRKLNDRLNEGLALSQLAQIHVHLGKVDEALSLFHESIIFLEQIDHQLFAAVHQLQRIALERIMGTPIQELDEEIERLEPLLMEAGDPAHLSLLYCEKGHLALCHGQSANAFVREARRALTSARLDPYAPTEAGLRLQRLNTAQKLFSKNRPLFYGEALKTLPPKLQEVLMTLHTP
ncbi:MAG: tetratricopeptide repeat protein [Deltaproteobacteria bacterium]|nr:MAG: tetratricopeptide repeat protein [Deltaproteobacteria bacterium]